MTNKQFPLKMTFAHLSAVSLQHERKLWRQGIVTWPDLRREAPRLFSHGTADRIVHEIDEAEVALAESNVDHFLTNLPEFARVRTYPLIRSNLLYIDIETTGLDRQRDSITTVATYDGSQVRIFIRDLNLDDLAHHTKQFKTWVTFNGDRFDLPFLRRDLGIKRSKRHLDLYKIMKDGGYHGGLKHLERRLNIARKTEAELTGKDAPSLWRAYIDGDRSSLERLVQYNANDVFSLERLLVTAMNFNLTPCPIYSPIPIPTQPSNVTSISLQNVGLA